MLSILVTLTSSTYSLKPIYKHKIQNFLIHTLDSGFIHSLAMNTPNTAYTHRVGFSNTLQQLLEINIHLIQIKHNNGNKIDLKKIPLPILVQFDTQ